MQTLITSASADAVVEPSPGHHTRSYASAEHASLTDNSGVQRLASQLCVWLAIVYQIKTVAYTVIVLMYAEQMLSLKQYLQRDVAGRNNSTKNVTVN